MSSSSCGGPQILTRTIFGTAVLAARTPLIQLAVALKAVQVPRVGNGRFGEINIKFAIDEVTIDFGMLRTTPDCEVEFKKSPMR